MSRVTVVSGRVSGALLRYVAADALRAGRWLAPGLLFLAATLMSSAGGGSALSSYSFTATVLLPVTVWLAVAVNNSEDPVQTAIVVVTVGSALSVRLAKLIVAYLTCVPLAAIGVVWPLATGHPANGTAVLVGVASHLLVVLAGVAVSSLLSHPVIDAMAWVVVLGVAFCLVEVIVPGFPPLRQLLVLLAGDGRPTLSGAAIRLGLISAETLLLSTVTVTIAHRIARSRT